MTERHSDLSKVLIGKIAQELQSLPLVFDNHGALTICLHSWGKPASVSAGFSLGGPRMQLESLNQKLSW
jgi:hypothetical protein